MSKMVNEEKEYAWEKGYEKTWEDLREGEMGLFAPISTTEPSKKRKHDDKLGRLGMIRNLVLILDCSESMLDQDLKPTRQLCTYTLITEFIKQFLESNSISQLGIISTRNKRAEKVSELSGNVRKLTEAFEKCKDVNYCKGEPSLQNSLEVALSMLKGFPNYSSREVLIISGTLTLVDPGNIQVTIEAMKHNGMRCSVIGLNAEMYVYKALCRATGGEYNIVLDDSHFQNLLLEHIKPHSANRNCIATCVKMGFCRMWDSCPSYSTCMCHMKDPSKLNAVGYFCPQCRSKCCELPTQCKTCGISLATSAHLVRPLHYLIPLPLFEECKGLTGVHKCYGCQCSINADTGKVLQCETCKQYYCEGCDEFIHNELHICPACAILQTNDL